MQSKNFRTPDSASLRSAVIHYREWSKAWLLLALLVSGFGMNLGRAAQEIEIYSLSLRFHSSTTTTTGATWRLELTSLPENTPPNGELALAEGTNDFTHAGFI